jgi:hypothetical protein
MCRIVLLLVAAVGCTSSAPKWERVGEPREPDAVFLREMLTDIVPDVPPPSKLRPCCAFGSGIKVRLGPIPVPGLSLVNIIGPEDVGVHRYDNGLMSVRRGQHGMEIVRESNGLVYTCRGGFLDTAHVRDYSDWTVYLAAQIARAADSGATLTLGNEGAVRKIHIKPLPADLVEAAEFRRTVAALSEYIAFQLSVWHEISTWLGWSASAAFSEESSAFSPEDLYSNLVGIKIAGRLLKDRLASSEQEYNEHLSELLIKSVELLGGIPADAGQGAARYVDGIWWQSEKRLPSADLVLRRNMEIGEVISPWRISEAFWSQEVEDGVEKYCGGDDNPVLLSNPSSYEGIVLENMITLELTLTEKTAGRLPIPVPEDRVITQKDFPRLIDAIRKKNDERYGEGASTPVRRQDAPSN